MAQLPTGSPRLGPLAICLVAGLAIGLGTGAAVFSSGDDKGSGSTKADTHAIELPATLAGFRDIEEVTATRTKQPKSLQQQRDHQQQLRTDTVAAYRKAFGGAAAAYRGYSNDSLDKMPYVIAVRAEAPGLTIGPVVDPAYFELATPDREVKAFGDVQCEIFWSPPALKGETPNPDDAITQNCRRSGSGTTVFVGGGGFDGAANQQLMVALTNAAWTTVSGH